ncbi:MAG: hypothetical protein ACRDLN_05885 [Solirubrobacteraceae bacterium]
MPGRLRNPLLLALLVAAVALGACGGGDDRERKNTYVRELNAAQAEFATDADAVSKERIPEGTSGRIRLVQRLQGAIDEVVVKLRAIDVPGDVRAEHQRLIDVMTGFRAAVQKLTQTYRGGDKRKVSAAVDAFEQSRVHVGTRINATIDAINSKLVGT